MKKGFTLLEIVFIVILLGMLIALAQVLYTRGIAKAHDTNRIVSLKNTKDIINLEVSNSNAIFANQSEFSGVLKKYGFRILPENELCYFIASIPAYESPSGHSEYIVATWGETTSTKRAKEFGILAVGTPQSVFNLTNANISKDNNESENALSMHDFSCEDSIRMQKVERAFLGDPSFFQ